MGQNGNKVLFACNFLSKGWEVSILGLLAIILERQHLPTYMVGFLSTAFIISQITVSFFAGKIAHAIHGRNVIFLSIAASGFSWLTLFFSSHVFLLYLAYVFGGVSSGLFEPIGNSLVAKLSTSSNRGTAIGNFAAFGDMGKIAVTGVTALAAFGVNVVCGVLFATAILAFIFADVFIGKNAGSSSGAEAPEIPVHLSELIENRKFCFATVAGIVDSFSSASLYFFIPYLFKAKGFALSSNFIFIGIFFVGYMLGRLALGRLADRHGAANILIGTKIMMAVLILLLTLAEGTASMVLLLFLLGVFTRGSSPIIRAMVADSMDERISFHNAFSAFSFASRGSSALSRPIFGYLLFSTGAASVFYVASAVSLLTLYPALKYKSSRHSHQPQEPDTNTEPVTEMSSAKQAP